jgi:anaphase-promoting complex subunit 3
MDHSNHDARHLYATALLREGQTYSAMNLVITGDDSPCTSCLELKAKCLTVLGSYREAREALEQAMHNTSYAPTGLWIMSWVSEHD